MPHVNWHRIVLLVALVSGCGWYPGINIAEYRERKDALEALDEGCESWKSKEITDYDWYFEEGWGGPNAGIRQVRNGADIVVVDGRAGFDFANSPRLLDANEIGTIDRLCDVEKTALGKSSDGVFVHFDPTYGYPTDISIRWDRTALDGGLSYRAYLLAIGLKLMNGLDADDYCSLDYLNSLPSKWNASYINSGMGQYRDMNLELYGTAITLSSSEWSSDITGQLAPIEPGLSPYCLVELQPLNNDQKPYSDENINSIVFANWIVVISNGNLYFLGTNHFSLWIGSSETAEYFTFSPVAPTSPSE